MKKTRPEWLAPAGLLLLCVVPIVAGALRLTQLTTGAEVTADNAKYFTTPAPVVIHIISVTVFMLLGALQFVPRLRRGRPSWHKVVGRILVPAGLLAAGSGLWMNLFYPPHDEAGAAFVLMRVVFGTGMLLSLLLAVYYVYRRDFVRHSAWMTRGYAIGLGAGTQVLTTLVWLLIVQTTEGTQFVPMAAGWIINLGVAELVIRKRARVLQLGREKARARALIS